MGDPNTGSTITARLNRLARRRMRYLTGSANRQNAVNALQGALTGAANAADARSRAKNPHLAVPLEAITGITPAITVREREHIDEVPDDIMLLSLEYIDIVVQGNIPCSYSVSRGNHWEVKLVLSEPGGDDPDEDGDQSVEAQISWVVPASPDADPT